MQYKRQEPLAYRMRPKKIEDIVGQEHIIGENTPLFKQIKNNMLSNIILWGNPGTGKTTIAEVLAKEAKYPFNKINAVTAGINDIRKIIEDTQNLFISPQGISILFIDEIHRFNKAQQDILLPYIEKGEIILIGATTENPYFEINKAILSRSMVLKLNDLSKDNIEKVLKRALEDKENGLGMYDVLLKENILKDIAQMSNGDVRFALNILEILVTLSDIEEDGKIHITKEKLKNTILSGGATKFDHDGEEHFNTISALIKSIRGSDENASIYYLAKLLHCGEDPKFIARRLIISASEDIRTC